MSCLPLCEALRRARMSHLARHQGIVSGNRIVTETDIGPGCVRLLSRKGKADQEFIKLPFPARESIDLMFTTQRLHTQIVIQRDPSLSKTVGSVNNRPKRG